MQILLNGPLLQVMSGRLELHWSWNLCLQFARQDHWILLDLTQNPTSTMLHSLNARQTEGFEQSSLSVQARPIEVGWLGC